MNKPLTKVIFAKLSHEEKNYITVDCIYYDKSIVAITKTGWKYDMDKIYWHIGKVKWEIKNFEIGINVEWERLTNKFITSQPYNYWWYAVFFSMA